MYSSTENIKPNVYNNLTRSEATKLVELYMTAIDMSQGAALADHDKYIAAHEMFRKMTQYHLMGSLLVDIELSDNCFEVNDMFFNSIKELVSGVEKEQSFVITSKYIRTTIMKHINRLQSMQIVTYLSCAIHNYYQANQPIIKEILGDNTNEYNKCYSCKWGGDDYFYYSTCYGLNKPICSYCVNKCDTEYDAQYNNDFFEYEEYECNKCQSCEYYGMGYFYHYINTDLNTPVCIDCKVKTNIPTKYTDSNFKEVVEDENNDTEEDEDALKAPDFKAEEYVEEDVEEAEYVEAVENLEEDEDDDKEVIFECNDCEDKWCDGWKKGWKAAMKQIKKFVTIEMRSENIHIPKCASCKGLHNLKKCSGSCEGAVSYCSDVCQRKDWDAIHKQKCLKV